MEPEQSFATELERLRLGRALSPAELARQLGVYEGDISRWRRGQGISIRNVRKVADFFGVDRDYLERLAGYPPAARADHSKPPLSVQQRSLDDEYDLWMKIMGPRMGRQEAHNAYWDPFVYEARTRREMIERALYRGNDDALNAAINPPNQPLKPAGVDDDAPRDTLSFFKIFDPSRLLPKRQLARLSA